MNKKGYLILICIFFSTLLTGYIVIKHAFNNLSGYLSKSEQVKANILVVEGWLPDYALQMADKEFRKKEYNYIVTTGLKSTMDYFQVSMNGYLIFYTKTRLTNLSKTGHHIIEINASSELGGDHRAHFNLFINDSLVADFLADKQKKKYRINWEGNLNDIDSIMVQFTNDALGDFGDHNLYVKEIIFDNNTRLPYQYNSVYDIGALDGKNRILNNFNSYAEYASNRILSMGIDSSSVITLPCKNVKMNRTLTSALAFRDWIKTKDLDIQGINIISMGTHARRTWMTYNRILDEKYKIGIISVPDFRNLNSPLKRVFKTLRETLGIIYYWIILIPY